MKRLFALMAVSFLPPWANASEPRCQTQTIGGHTAKICVVEVSAEHDYYTLAVDNALIISAPDDYIEHVSLMHTVPDGAVTEFDLSKQGTPTVTIEGGCLPVSTTQQMGAETVGVEVGRVCSFKWGREQIVKDMRFRF
jgi:hypothetical protein